MGFFDYDRREAAASEGALEFLPDRGPEDWAAILEATELRRFSAGELVVRRGERDRSLYLLMTGRLEARRPDGTSFLEVEAPTVVGEIAFLDGGGRSLDLYALTSGEVRRLGMEAFEALAARRPELGRAVLLEVGRIVATRLRRMTERAGM